ncbi:MAG: DotU family type VI secretion system protein [Mitsuaria chitosanitabida]|uniref:DotU family type VI secretion system protein n=1 Tax=Roseateles chitosanitabidus TaxID=65048 RepID=UPI001B250095|nr:DotU family type VI secretion system protein [Roseateles chitosanitabidus]MBO9687493.1 DotU family type VI secretion system protein [Roseateles chitosanitabidus]
MDPSALNDPFAGFDDQRTFIKPRPGGAQAPRGSAPAEAPAPADAGAPAPGLNPLLSLANPLLLLVPQLRATRRVDDVAALRNNLAQGIRDFASRAAAAGIPPERVMATRYVLCTMIDEAAADTPWGGSGVWARHSLLSMFHNETWGGEKVFQLMARLAEKPDANRDLLELIYAALTLGFAGRYRVIDNGHAQLEAVRDRLAQILKQQRGDYPAALAQHWQVEATATRRHIGWLPLAAIAALTTLILVGVYLTLTLSLAERSDPVFGQIQSLRLSPPVVAPPPPPAKPRLAQFLQSDIKAGLVAVRDEVDRSVVTIRGDGLFAPASATVVPERDALMTRIADALAQVQGTVLVTGHSDNTPIRTARFPSNWHLSEERAHTVRELLIAHRVAAERIRAEGRADAEPVAPNDTPANRALNRRVEISLMINGRAPEAPARGASR